ncbi:MAG: molybdopterin-dependent oxidoreductase [Dehalococcoidales bacterium]|nr:molybdopterin-dependent oxidoreductase [Dehalococcoidales bacterium]
MAEQVFIQCTVGGPVRVYVEDGKIKRMRPIIFDDKEDAPSWVINAHGRKFTPPRKTTLQSYEVPERMRVYAENRIKYPMKRKTFDPNGERHPEMRGKDEFVRISWDEALDIVAGEIKRIRQTYGPAAITAMTSSHHNWGFLHYKLGPLGRFFNLLGYTTLQDNPDSWEGWHWGAIHTWGYWWRLGHCEQSELLQDALKNSEQIIFWSVDPNSTSHMYSGQENLIWRIWMKELGIKFVFIDPYCNCTASTMGDTWLAPRPGTDAALAEAIGYVWIKEGTYDKWFVENRMTGFNEWKKHILGKEDGTPRTPQWAAEICGIPAHTITALAREWAAKKTMLAVGSIFGATGACREAYATEWARLMVLLGSMQGVGKPGVNFWGGTAGAAPIDYRFNMPGYSENGWDAFGIVAKKSYFPEGNKVTQKAYRLLLPEIVMNPPVSWIGEGFCGNSVEQQFNKFTCPEPGPNGAPIKMIHRHGGSFISTMTETNRWVKMYQHPNLEFVVMQDCHWQSETRFGDVILPASTNFEHSDLSEWNSAGGYGCNDMGNNHRVIIYQQQCIEPLWESKPDYEIYTLLAERLGIKDEYTEGNSFEDWNKKVFEYSDLPKYVKYEDFKKKGYFVVPSIPPDEEPLVSFRWYYEGRPCDLHSEPKNPNMGTDRAHLLGTPSGKIEFVSQTLLKFDPDDEERPPMPRYIPSWEGYNTKRLTRDYPLQLISPHPRFSYHTHNDNKSLWLDDIPQHRVKKDGYAYWPIRIHPQDAAKRDIRDGDLVKVYNARGAVICSAHVTERIKPGCCHSYEAGAKYDPLEPGKSGSIDRGGCINLLTPSRMVSKNAPGEANNSCLVEVCKWEA